MSSTELPAFTPSANARIAGIVRPCITVGVEARFEAHFRRKREMAIAELTRLGVQAALRSRPGDDTPWWRAA